MIQIVGEKPLELQKLVQLDKSHLSKNLQQIQATEQFAGITYFP